MRDVTKALLLFSGGQDSATCLAWALDKYDYVETVGFHYGQRHDIEMTCRETIRQTMPSFKSDWKNRLGPDHVLDLSVLGQMSETALTRDVEIKMNADGMPNTFVPGRNLVFLTFAGALAYRRGINDLVGGMCEADFSGYPDCRKETLDAQMQALSLGLDRPMTLSTPLMHLSKAQAWGLCQTLGGDDLVSLVNEKTHSCYKGNHKDQHSWGFGCGECPACELRAAGWNEFTS
ncbi:preQ(0) biosynthesis protein QueC [Litorimonas taeanensis]|uniref:7-cyano-7-deazaguanine synthase n=1 Tax=Litorimonas taeanensis TaxID=568099 RepID=A0A420WJU4_9PROT|nr:7-cyano-7-deazaguanine synthase QueC [Litorimonas taeanensis]RKQ71219.1 preQ(0) biosynthesis protein QueC [Litorimonas taeanensis]